MIIIKHLANRVRIFLQPSVASRARPLDKPGTAVLARAEALASTLRLANFLRFAPMHHYVVLNTPYTAPKKSSFIAG